MDFNNVRNSVIVFKITSDFFLSMDTVRCSTEPRILIPIFEIIFWLVYGNMNADTKLCDQDDGEKNFELRRIMPFFNQTRHQSKKVTLVSNWNVSMSRLHWCIRRFFWCRWCPKWVFSVFKNVQKPPIIYFRSVLISSMIFRKNYILNLNKIC